MNILAYIGISHECFCLFQIKHHHMKPVKEILCFIGVFIGPGIKLPLWFKCLRVWGLSYLNVWGKICVFEGLSVWWFQCFSCLSVWSFQCLIISKFEGLRVYRTKCFRYLFPPDCINITWCIFTPCYRKSALFHNSVLTVL